MNKIQLSAFACVLLALTNCNEPSRNNRDKPASGPVTSNVDTTKRSKAYTADVGFNGDEKNFLTVVSSNSLYAVEASKIIIEKSTNQGLKTLARTITKELGKTNADLYQIAEGKGLLLDKTLGAEEQKKLSILKNLDAQHLNSQYLTTIANCYGDLTQQLNKIKKFKEKNLITFADQLLPQATSRFAEISKLKVQHENGY